MLSVVVACRINVKVVTGAASQRELFVLFVRSTEEELSFVSIQAQHTHIYSIFCLSIAVASAAAAAAAAATILPVRYILVAAASATPRVVAAFSPTSNNTK